MSITRVPAVAAGGALALSPDPERLRRRQHDHGSRQHRQRLSAAAPSSAPPATAVSTHANDADVEFAQMMIPHHQQAIAMAEIAVDRAQRAEVTSLAEQIRTAQGPEITQLTGFLTAWGASVPTTTGVSAGMNGSGMSGMNGPTMPGMMTDAQMNELRNASGAAFDTMFLQMMIEHHRGAVTDAQQEVDNGSNPEATQLATKIVADQTAEIGRMQQLLA